MSIYEINGFIEAAEKIHGKDRYDYSKACDLKAYKKTVIICPKHGEFLQAPNVHVKGHGCPRCAIDYLFFYSTSNTKEFIKKSNKIHNNFYDYSKTEYVKSGEHLEIICPIHGSFKSTPDNHLAGKRCPKCAREINIKKRTLSAESFIEASKLIHGNKYYYYTEDYINRHTKIRIGCPHHGIFKQAPSSHLQGHGCQKCSTEINKFKKRLSSENPATLYYIKILKNEDAFYKIGVTTKSIKERFKKEFLDIFIIASWEYDHEKDAYRKEQEIINYFRQFKIKYKILKGHGNSEIFSKDILGLDTEFSHLTDTRA